MHDDTRTHFRTKLALRWADIDANFHLRHSVFYDLCSQQRMDALKRVGITMALMEQQGFAPILFREECTFRREIKLDDEVYVEVSLKQLNKDHSRFSFAHTFTKADGTHCALLVIDGAWMDTRLRKLTAPPLLAQEGLDQLPRTADFQWT